MLSPGHIQKRISATAERYGVEVLYACESGSRAWGLGSTDSDYDVRFVYRHSREWYLSLSPDEDQIGPIMEHEGELDLVGWDVRKFLYHIAAGNPGVQEWLGSPIIYQAETDFQLAARQLADDYFRPRRAMLHYLGIARCEGGGFAG